MNKIETTEQIEPATPYLKQKGIDKVGSFQRYTFELTDRGLEVTDWSITKYHYKDGHAEESANGCTITIANQVRKKVSKAIGDA